MAAVRDQMEKKARCPMGSGHWGSEQVAEAARAWNTGWPLQDSKHRVTMPAAASCTQQLSPLPCTACTACTATAPCRRPRTRPRCRWGNPPARRAPGWPARQTWGGWRTGSVAGHHVGCLERLAAVTAPPAAARELLLRWSCCCAQPAGEAPEAGGEAPGGCGCTAQQLALTCQTPPACVPPPAARCGRRWPGARGTPGARGCGQGERIGAREESGRASCCLCNLATRRHAFWPLSRVATQQINKRTYEDFGVHCLEVGGAAGGRLVPLLLRLLLLLLLLLGGRLHSE